MFPILIGWLVLAVGTMNAQCICTEPRLKPLRCVRGVISDESGAPVSQATVSIVQDGQVLHSAETSEAGKFSFVQPIAGRYVLWARADGLRSFEYPIVVAKPAKKCSRSLAIILKVGGGECAQCPNISLVKERPSSLSDLSR